MSRVMPAAPEYLRAAVSGRPAGVDKENKVLRGYVIAQLGPFKSAGRGQFDQESFDRILALARAMPAGLKSRFSHPTASDDGLGKFLGRSRNLRQEGDRLRADLHLDPTAFGTPSGNLGGYVLDLAESDPDALSSSLVLKTDRAEVLDEKGKPKLDEKGEKVPPLWRPTKLYASDIVDTGDAVDGLLSAGVDVDGLPLAALWRGAELLDRVFADQPRDVVEARCLGFLRRYLAMRYGDEPGVSVDVLRRRLKLNLAEKGLTISS
jgi:hypothetical protein